MDIQVIFWRLISVVTTLRTFGYVPLFMPASLVPVLILTFVFHPTGWPWYWVVIVSTQLMSLVIHVGAHIGEDTGGAIERAARRLLDEDVADWLMSNFHLVWMALIDVLALRLLLWATGSWLLVSAYAFMACWYELYSLAVHQMFVKHRAAVPIVREPAMVAYLGLIAFGLCPIMLYAVYHVLHF